MDKKPLNEIFMNIECDQILQDLIKSKNPEAPYEYTAITKEKDGKTYTITAIDLDLQKDVFTKANPSCNTCNSKGYYINNIEKKKYPNPDAFMVIKPEDVNVPENLTEEQKNMMIEMRKKRFEENKFWRVLQTCHCSAKRTLKDPNVFTNSVHTLFTKMEYEVSDIVAPDVTPEIVEDGDTEFYDKKEEDKSNVLESTLEVDKE